MYSTIIKLKHGISDNKFQRLDSTIQSAFSNRAGTVVNSSIEPYHYKFTGDDNDYACLEIGLLIL